MDAAKPLNRPLLIVVIAALVLAYIAALVLFPAPNDRQTSWTDDSGVRHYCGGAFGMPRQCEAEDMI